MPWPVVRCWLTGGTWWMRQWEWKRRSSPRIYRKGSRLRFRQWHCAAGWCAMLRSPRWKLPCRGSPCSWWIRRLRCMQRLLLLQWLRTEWWSPWRRCKGSCIHKLSQALRQQPSEQWSEAWRGLPNHARCTWGCCSRSRWIRRPGNPWEEIIADGLSIKDVLQMFELDISTSAWWSAGTRRVRDKLTVNANWRISTSVTEYVGAA